MTPRQLLDLAAYVSLVWIVVSLVTVAVLAVRALRSPSASLFVVREIVADDTETRDREARVLPFPPRGAA